ncbi:MAG: DUF4190 domain-containing protein [Kiritimatiellia bacterium]|nr:DUF4190 domain-containing protein [Kiritimatiellia bacterium]
MKKTARMAFVLMWLLMATATGYSQQPLVYETINEAAEKGDLADVKRHLERGADVNSEDGNGWTPVMAAVDESHQDIFNYLVAKGANVSEERLKMFLVCVEDKMTKYFLNKVNPPSVPDYSDFQPSLMQQRQMMDGTHAQQRKAQNDFEEYQQQMMDNARKLYQQELSKYNSALKYARAAARQDRADIWKAMLAAVPVVSEVTPVVNKQSKQEAQTIPTHEQERQQVSVQPQQERQITPAPDSSIAAVDTGVFLNHAKTILIIEIIVSVSIILVGILAAIVNRDQDKGKQIGFAVAGLMLSIFGTSISICWVLGIVFGHIALAKSKNNPVQYGGRIIALTALWLGYFTLCSGIVMAVLKLMMGAQIDEVVQELIRTGRMR